MKGRTQKGGIKVAHHISSEAKAKVRIISD